MFSLIITVTDGRPNGTKLRMASFDSSSSVACSKMSSDFSYGCHFTDIAENVMFPPISNCSTLPLLFDTPLQKLRNIQRCRLAEKGPCGWPIGQ